VADSEVAKRRDEHAAWSVDQYQVPPAEGKKRFQDFDLPTEILHAVADMGFQYCTPIQAQSLEFALAGKNVTGKAQTGTGKTAAFLLAILTRYLRSPESRQEQGGAPRALVIAPTRELVIQICKDAAALGKYCGLRSLAVYGGMDYDRQKREVMDAPVDLLVATPGRLLDFVRSRVVDLSKVDTLVIDEADRMLDMGFIPDVRSIINRLPPKEKRGTMLYSATLTDDVMKLAMQWMEAPVRVETECEQVTTKSVKQIVYVVTAREKFTVLYNQIQQYPDSRMLIFCNRRNTTEDVADSLTRRGIRCEMLSGDVNQNRRLRVLEDFREGKVRIVVATDVAGRGLHVDDIGFVINFDFPYEPEDYVHRIGRTGRAGASGTAISFADEDESFIIPGIEKYIGEELKCTVLTHDDPLLTKMPEVPRAHRDRPVHTDRDARPPRPEARDERPRGPAPAPREEPAAPTQPHGELLPPVSAPAPVAPPPPAAHRPVEPAQPPKPVAERPREPQHAPAPAQSPAAARRPRFSEDWVPGQGSK
jgi:ATP-dependent RNA helicase RhlB